MKDFYDRRTTMRRDRRDLALHARWYAGCRRRAPSDPERRRLQPVASRRPYTHRLGGQDPLLQP